MTTRVPYLQIVRVVVLASMTALGIAVGHRLWQSLASRPFLDPRIDRIGNSGAFVPRLTPVGKEGSEILVVLIGSSRCAASRQPVLVAAMKALRERIVGVAAKNGMQVAFVGVALDDNLSTGLKWLVSVGPFDEIGVGRNWLNSYMIHLVHRDLPGDAAIPQLIVIRRAVSSTRAGTVLVGSDDIVAREVGLDGIRELAAPNRSILGTLVLGPDPGAH